MLYQLKLSRPFSCENSPLSREAEYAFSPTRCKPKACRILRNRVAGSELGLTPPPLWLISLTAFLVMTSARSHLLSESFRMGWSGAKANLRAGVILWLVGSVLVGSYYSAPPVRQLLDDIGQFKVAFTPWFAMISTAAFGALLPFVFQLFFLPKEKKQSFRQVSWLVLFWAIHGWQVDWLFRLQAMAFGDEVTFAILLKKMMVDQLVWSPLFALPQVVLVYLFVENDCSLGQTRKALQRRGYLTRAIPILVVNWVVWIPAVTLIYLLPLALQLPLQNLILSLWCLLLLFFAKHGDRPTELSPSWDR